MRTARAKGLGGGAVVLQPRPEQRPDPDRDGDGLQLAAAPRGRRLDRDRLLVARRRKYVYDAATSKDIPALQGAVLVVSVFFTVANFLVDLSYGLIDPRVRVS